MDPNATLAEIRRLCAEIDGTISKGYRSTMAGELAELCEALDGWISRGGFVPSAWSKAA